MNRWVYEQNAMAAYQDMRMESVVCPKPRRLVLQTPPDNDPIRAYRWPIRFVNPNLIFFLLESRTFFFQLCRFELESRWINFWYVNMLACSHSKTGNSRAGAEFLDMILTKVLNYHLSRSLSSLLFILIDYLFPLCMRLMSYHYQQSYKCGLYLCLYYRKVMAKILATN